MSMAEAKQKTSWSVASEIIAAIYNTVRDSKKRSKPFTGSEFNPFYKKPQPIEMITVREWAKRSGKKIKQKG